MERAVHVLRQVPDFLEVRNNLNVEPGEMPVPMFLPDRPAVPAPAILPGFSPLEDAGASSFSRKTARSPSQPTSVETVRFKVAAPGRTPEGEEKVGFVLPAITVPGGWQAAPAPIPGKLDKLEEAIRRLQQGDARYTRLRAVVQPGQIILSGTAVSWDDVYSLAGALAKLPGVERVILDQVRTSPAKK
jgi:hypothetical protein